MFSAAYFLRIHTGLNFKQIRYRKVTVDGAHEVITSTTLWTAVGIFLISYAAILSEKINRAIVAVLGGGLMVLTGVLNQEQAVQGMDFNTLGLLLGMMIIVAITKESGIFQYVAIRAAKMVKAEPMKVLVIFAIVTAVFSALLDNVTTVLLTTPIILLITRELDLKPYPFLFTSILASNIGGSATLIGDPPNIMIGSAANLGFSEFVMNLAPVSGVIMVLTMIPIVLFWRKDLVADERARERIMKLNEDEAIKDKVLLAKATGVLALVIAGFTIGHGYHIQPATVAMTGAALLLLLDNCHLCHDTQEKKVHHNIAEAEWVTLFFFGGLFVIVYGIEHVGVIEYLANQLLSAVDWFAAQFNMQGQENNITIMAILWGAAVLSALVDNIPFVATMIPMVESMKDTFGGTEGLKPVWWALALGACLGGNGSLIGASANLVVAGFASRAGHAISFTKFMAGAFPLMLFSIVIATIYVYFRFM